MAGNGDLVPKVRDYGATTDNWLDAEGPEAQVGSMELSESRWDVPDPAEVRQRLNSRSPETVARLDLLDLSFLTSNSVAVVLSRDWRIPYLMHGRLTRP